MTDKEKLFYLIRGVKEGRYTVPDFCDEFSRIYDLELEEELSEIEEQTFDLLGEVTGRFSPFVEDITELPNGFSTEKEVMEKVNLAIVKLLLC